ncbi:MAG: alkaline phosphatase PhoX, partial [Verrucomicrobiota bacterium]
MSLSRRVFLKQASIAGVGFVGLRQFIAHPAFAETAAAGDMQAVGYGSLAPGPESILSLPKGFSMKVISRRHEPMADGLLIPGMQDGMAAFPAEDGRIVLVCNHENEPDWVQSSPFGSRNERLRQINRSLVYDIRDGKQPCIGGTTNIVYNPKTGEVENEFLSLIGTERNCAGGPTPWGTWITCEETAQTATDGFRQDHGYNFEVPATTKPGLVEPIPLKAMGRFRGEAIAVDEPSGVIYQSEDLADGCFYRFIPKVKGKPAEGGTLQALVVKGQPVRDTRNWSREVEPFPIGQSFDASWVTLKDVESPQDDLRYQAQEKGAAIFARMEGMWASQGEIYFACTSGGPETWGQVFRYIPSPYEGTAQESSSPGKLE